MERAAGERDDLRRQLQPHQVNGTATAAGLIQRLTAHTDGTLAGLHALLAAGQPVIVHGYFTGYGHVVVVLGFDGPAGQYVVHDPAGRWSQTFKGGYPGPADPLAGRRVRYAAAAFERAVTSDASGGGTLPLWYHELR